MTIHKLRHFTMEECKALCTRLVIMVDGRFHCLGSPQHLKSKFGKGYTLTIQTDQDTYHLKRFIQATFPGSVLKDERLTKLYYLIPAENLNWSVVFRTLEDMKTTYNVSDYCISQATLEQIFTDFAKGRM